MKGAKRRGVATQWAPEGNEWRIETHQGYGASRADTGRPDADAIRRTHFFFLLMQWGGEEEQQSAPGLRVPSLGQVGLGQRCSDFL